MGLRMNLTKADLTFDGWDIDVMISACNERLEEILETHERYANKSIMGASLEDLWGWWWHLASNLHEGKRAIEDEIAARDNSF